MIDIRVTEPGEDRTVPHTGDDHGSARAAEAGDRRPRALALGVGVEPGTPVEDLLAAVAALGEIDVHVIATIDRRLHEPAVTALAGGRQLIGYPADVLDAVDVPHPSAVVRRLAGTGSVAEAAAILAARDTGGAGVLVVGKQRGRRVTVALAR
jgi:cobalamin biosynthesis protein CbiG